MHRYALVLLALLSIPAVARPVGTIGSESCGKFAQDLGTDDAQGAFYRGWISGFFSGTNLVRSRSAASYDYPSIEKWLLNYCSANPLDSLMRAAQKLDLEIEKREKGA